MLLAMHMANELLSVPVAAATLLVGGAAVALAARRAGRTLDPERFPLMGVMGAFVFAAQMINFTLPGMSGTSGHLGGGVLLAIVLGPAAAIVTMAGILIVQCLMFQDGGLLALGCNVINMGVVPILLGWAIYRRVLGDAKAAPPWRQYLAAWLACVAGAAGGAALVPVQAGAAGVLRVPPVSFLAVMVGVHLLIGFVEGLITFAVVAFLRRVRPSAVGLAEAETGRSRFSRRALAGSMVVTAALLAGVVSWFASTHEDGLEWALGRGYGQTRGTVAEPGPAMARATELQAKAAVFPDYTLPAAETGESEPVEASWPGVSGWGSLAGLAGTAVTLGLVWGAAVVLRRRTPLP